MRLGKPTYSRLVRKSEHFKGGTVEAFYEFLRDHANGLTDDAIAAELKDYLSANELAGLNMRFRGEWAKL